MKQSPIFPSSVATEKQLPVNRYRACVGRCLDNLLAYGTDRYGPVKTPMLMSIIDVRTSEAPQHPLLLDGLQRAGGRPGRLNAGGCDLWEDQHLLHALEYYSSITGNPRYAQAGADYIRAYFADARLPNGLLAWGPHLFYNAYTDQVEDDGCGHHHEILNHLAEWDAMWRVDPAGVRREIEGIWEWHIVDKETGQHNRHDDAKPDCDFSFAAGPFLHAFAFLFSQTQDRVWLERAKLVAHWHWRHRHPQTNLIPDMPFNSRGDRYDSKHCFTTEVGPHAAALLKSFEITQEPFFRDVALAYIKAWLQYAWDEKAGRFFAALQLDGTPVPDRPKVADFNDYDVWMPTGYAETWPSDIYSYETTLLAAQTCIYAYELTDDPALLAGAQKWARHIRASLPATIGRRWQKEIYAVMPEAERKGGAYAEGYGRAILFFVHLHRATKDPEDLETARHLADEAIDKLSENGWLKGHAGKPYYQSLDDVGILLCALLELSDSPNSPWLGLPISTAVPLHGGSCWKTSKAWASPALWHAVLLREWSRPTES